MEYKSCLITPSHLFTSPEVSEHATLRRILEVNTRKLISAVLPEIIYTNCGKKKNPKKGKRTLRLVHGFLLCKDQWSYNERKESPLYQELKSKAVMQALAQRCHRHYTGGCTGTHLPLGNELLEFLPAEDLFQVLKGYCFHY